VDDSIQDDDEPAIAAITLAEARRRCRARLGQEAQSSPSVPRRSVTLLPVLTYDLEVARSHTQLLVAARASGRPRGARDLIIAATAWATRRTVVSTDDNGFEDLAGVPGRKPA
jgi:tRNA(fMet)-specific endonuclease VapC